jgi:hypothetical protein
VILIETKGNYRELDRTIIRWTSDNPGGSPEHFGVVRYGTDPKNLSQTTKSHIRLNPTHSYTVFRVRMEELRPKTTYYSGKKAQQRRSTILIVDGLVRLPGGLAVPAVL